MNTRPPKLKQTILIIVCLLLVGTVAVGAIALLRNIAPKATENSNTTTATSAEEIIKALQTPGTIKSLEGFNQQTNPSDTTQITYKADDRSYAISAPTKGSVLFVASAPGPQPNTIEEEMVKFITERGYEKTETTGTTPPSTKYITLKSPVGVCQIASPQPAEGQQTLVFYQIACADTAAISQEYSNLERLLSVYKESGGKIPPFTSASRSTITEENKSFSIVTLNGGDTRASLLFASIDNDWEFIGDLTGDKDTVANGKYGISAEMRSKINSSQYGDFLRKYFP